VNYTKPAEHGELERRSHGLAALFYAG